MYIKKFFLIILFLSFFSTITSNSEEFKLTDIKPKDLVKDGYVLHSVISISEEGPRVMLYTFIKDSSYLKIVSCVVELYDIAKDFHICYNITN